MKKSFPILAVVFLGLLLLMMILSFQTNEGFEASLDEEVPRLFSGPLHVFADRPEQPLAEIPGVVATPSQDTVYSGLVTDYTDMAKKTTRESRDISQLPDFKAKTQYFSEVSLEDIKKCLDLSKTASLRQPWNHMYKHALKIAQPFEPEVTRLLETMLNTCIDVREPTSNMILKFKVKSITLEGVASELASKPDPAFYSKWNVVVHRDNKAYGFSFHAIFLHLGIDLKDIDTFFCHHEHHTLLFEDAVENISDLSVQYSSSSSGFSPWSL